MVSEDIFFSLQFYVYSIILRFNKSQVPRRYLDVLLVLL